MRQGWQNLAEKHGVPLPAVAMAFSLLPTCVDKLVIGMTPKGVGASEQRFVTMDGAARTCAHLLAPLANRTAPCPSACACRCARCCRVCAVLRVTVLVVVWSVCAVT